ncbi:DUF1080 domain-containing protein [Balneolaceae bacterium ANBcel3]|nr:DUF1080 domain-containing protein [Balneolaceae bacterium ANBcel3]
MMYYLNKISGNVFFRIIPAFLIWAGMTGCASESPERESEQQPGHVVEWRMLFDGTTTNGWRGYNRPDFPEEGWVVENGVLHCKGTGGGDIVFDETFKDVHLSLEWKISEGGNSGIFYLGQEIEGQPIWMTAPEMQILDNENHPDALQGTDGNRKAGSLYDLIPAVPQNTHPFGEWNVAEVRIQNGHVIHRQNGEKVLEYHLESSEFKQLVQQSKFEDVPSFARYEAGVIGLQDHGDDVWFRNIKIKVLED